MKSVFSKALVLILALALLSSLTACSNAVDSEGLSLELHGMDVVRMMEELVKSEFYGNAMSGSSEIHAVAAAAAAGNYDECKAVYKITVPALQSLLETAGDEKVSMEGFSEELMQHLENRNVSAVMSQINALDGAYAVAAASMYTASKTFVSDELTNSMIYLYEFENGAPVAVTFLKGEDNTVSANGQFMLKKDFPIDSAEGILGLLDGMYPGCTVELIA